VAYSTGSGHQSPFLAPATGRTKSLEGSQAAKHGNSAVGMILPAYLKLHTPEERRKSHTSVLKAL
jgi:hypothetical protein